MRRRTITTITAFLLAFPLFLTASAAAGNTAWLGIYTQTVDSDLKEAFDLEAEKGVIVKYVVPDSPADVAGLRQGDIVLKIDKKATNDADQLIEIVTARQPGDEIELLVIRDSKEKTLKARLDERSNREEPPMTMHRPGRMWHHAPKSYTKSWTNTKFRSNNTYIGIGLESMSKQLAEYFGVTKGTGVLVSEVYEDSPAEKAGLKAGDVIVKVDGNEFERVADVQEAVLDKDEGEKIELTVLRDKKEKQFTLDVEKAPDTFGNAFFHNLPDVDWDNFQFQIPRMPGMFRGDYDDNVFDSESFRDQMKDLKEEMEQLKKELQELKEND